MTFAEFWTGFKEGWMFIGGAIGRFNIRLLIAITYFTVFAITAIVIKLLGRDVLDQKMRDRKSYWHKKEKEEHTMEAVSRPY